MAKYYDDKWSFYKKPFYLSILNKLSLHVSRNVNDKLCDKLTVLERKCHANEQYPRRECLEISGIPAEVEDKDTEKKYWRFWMQSAPQLTQIWLRTVIVYPLKVPPKELF